MAHNSNIFVMADTENMNLQSDLNIQTDNNTNINISNSEQFKNSNNKYEDFSINLQESQNKILLDNMSKVQAQSNATRRNSKHDLNSDNETTKTLHMATNELPILVDSDHEKEGDDEFTSRVVENQEIDGKYKSKFENSNTVPVTFDSTMDELTCTSDTNEDEYIFHEIHALKKKSRLINYDSESENENINETVAKPTESCETTQRLKNLCDSESSVEETDDIEEISTKSFVQKKIKTKKTELKEIKMTGKEALEQRREIVSNNQKMVRESKISLPYHVPRQHTLKEFLKRRSLVRGSSNEPLNTSTGLSIKMCSKNIKTIQTKLKQKEKEIEEFYKSESDTEDQQETEQSKQEQKLDIENEINDVSKIDIQAEQENIKYGNERHILIGNFMDETGNEKTTRDLNINSKKIQTADDIQESRNLNDDQNNIVKELLHQEMDEVEIQENIENKLKNVEENLNIDESSSEVQVISEIQESDKDILILQHDTDKYVSNLNVNFQEDKGTKIAVVRYIKENLNPTKQEIPDETNEKNIIESKYTESECTELNSQTEFSGVVKILEKDTKLAAIEEKLKKLNPLVAIKGNLQPRLSGGPNEFIVLDANIEKSKQVNNFMQRFLNHAVKKYQQEELSTVDNNMVTSENLEDERNKNIQIPGVKMKMLRMNLAYQINQQRLEDLKKKQKEENLHNDSELYTTDGTCVLSNQVLDNEEEEELTDSCSSSEEDVEEDTDEEDGEAYTEIMEKPRMTSALINDEAEESDDVEQNDVEENDDYDERKDSDVDESIKTNKNISSKKTLKRIITLSEDSDDDVDSRLTSFIEKEKKSNEHILEEAQLNKYSHWDGNDNDIPAYQQPSDELEKTPCKIGSQKHDFTNILTPTVHLTALQGMDSTTKSLHGSPNINSFLPPDPSPLKLNSLVKTKLFIDQEESNLNECENLCYGELSTQFENKIEKRIGNLSTQENELLNICSGRFTGFTQNESNNIKSGIHIPKATQSLDLLMNEDSNSFKLTIENDTTDYNKLNTIVEQQKLLEDKSNQNSKSNIENLISEKNILNSKYPIMKICSSSEEKETEEKESVLPKIKKLRKKKRKYIIDDISISDEDDIKENLNEFNKYDEPYNKNYDSEENEIENEDEHELEDDYNPFRKTSDFVEAEAELSESDWGSEDEDEKNLDDYEIEEGDAEEINEKKVQRELGRMHMRNILDDDQKEVKLLQELLLEDGELHGTGRERKFRWKNADALWNNDSDKTNEKEEEHEEMECELQWRKMRHERELFLKEHQNKQKDSEEDILNDSVPLKLGHVAMKKSLGGFETQNLSQKISPIAESVAKMEDIKLPFLLANKRGSFLQRSETTLQRLAEITKINGNIGGPKNSKNFIFTSVTKTEHNDDEEVNIKKRKAEGNTPKILKKLRIADMSPNLQRRKKKIPL